MQYLKKYIFIIRGSYFKLIFIIFLIVLSTMFDLLSISVLVPFIGSVVAPEEGRNEWWIMIIDYVAKTVNKQYVLVL